VAVRIFELAKELNMPSKDLIAYLRTQGHIVKSHMSNIPDSVAAIIRERKKPKTPPKPPPQPVRPLQPGRPDVKPPLGGGPPGGGGPQRGGPPPYGQRPQRPGFPGPARPDAAATAQKPPSEWEKRGETKDKEKEKEKEPTRKRYFPTREDLYESGPRFGGGRRRMGGRPKGRKNGGPDSAVATTEKPAKIEVTLPITVKDLSAAMGVKGASIIKTLFEQGHPVNINQFLNEDLVTTIGVEFNVDIDFKKAADVEESISKIETSQKETRAEDLLPRAPVVTFLGHVDHGKTSLLDKIRETSVTAKEAGGITQHLGAYRVDRGNVHVVFIDTPGHQAFTEMRARGANVTDVAVLVVAADDGVMPQTEEALNHAKAASVPIVVAINKIDKPAANAMRVKQQLTTLGLQPVEWGGATEFVEVSAVTSQGIDHLLETLSLTAELQQLKANPARPAIGIVLEAEASTSRGVLATVLVRDGTLRQGDYVLCGPAHGRVRGMWLNGLTPIQEAGPSTPVKITGLNMVPEAGEKLYVFADFQEAREIAESRLRKKREIERADRQQVTVDNLFSTLKEEAAEVVRLIIKSDVKGSAEALRSSLENLAVNEIKVKILHVGVGAITLDDVVLASASKAIVIGFNVSADERARSYAEEKNVDIRIYQVIYKVLDDVRGALEQRLAPQKQEEVRGHAEIRQVFKASKIGNIAGCMVTDGVIHRSDQIRLVRDGRIVHTGTLSSLKRFKDDAREVKESFECGIKIANYDDIKVGDTIEAFAIVEKPWQL
jgi:translation initiation factor IF-2